MSESELLVAVDGPILEVTFNRLAKHHALSNAMLDGLHAALIRLQSEPELRVMLIRSQGKYFSSGMDLHTLAGGLQDEGPSAFRLRYRNNARHDLWDFVESIEKPIVVAHQGVCLGAGLEMSLSCDFRFASERAEYGLPELDTGMIPGSGGISRLTRAIGGHWARWLVMAGERLSAEQALSAGLVHAIWPEAELDERARAFCRKLAARPAEAMAAAKLAIEFATDLDRAQGRNMERLINSGLAGGDEQKRVFAELMKRFTRPNT